jgi:hypothetical protein
MYKYPIWILKVIKYSFISCIETIRTQIRIQGEKTICICIHIYVFVRIQSVYTSKWHGTKLQGCPSACYLLNAASNSRKHKLHQVLYFRHSTNNKFPE